MKTIGKSTPRDIIFTTAFGLPHSKACLFFRSLARIGYAGRIVVFTANLGPRERAMYSKAGAMVIDHGIHLHRVLRRLLQLFFWPMIRHWPDAGAFSPPWDRLQQPNVLRWALYRRYLLQHRDEFDRVLMVDLRDVCFQRDPFEGIDEEHLRIHAEENDILVRQSEWNMLAMRRAFGNDSANRWADMRVSCSGVVAGGIGPVLKYLEAFRRWLPRLQMPDHGTDQIVHTVLAHLDLAELVRWQGNRLGDAVQLAVVRDPDCIPRDASGRLLDASGTPFAILHQFDRHPALVAALHKEYHE